MFRLIHKNCKMIIFSLLFSAFGVTIALPSERNEEFSTNCGITNATSSNQIIGGSETEPGDWPWMVFITHGGQFCGGTLIDNIHVITAAHCVAERLRSMKIRIGDYNIRDGFQESMKRVVKSAIHPGYKVYWDLPDQPSINDIAVLTLDEPVTFSKYVSPICLPTHGEDYVGEIATTIGYGYVRPGGPNSDVIRKLSSPVWSNEACQIKHFRGPVLDSHICSGEPGRAAGAGDSGSPLMIYRNGRWYIIGIVGWGREVCNVEYCGKENCEPEDQCGVKASDPEYPAVYARVSYYLPWIKQNL